MKSDFITGFSYMFYTKEHPAELLSEKLINIIKERIKTLDKEQHYYKVFNSSILNQSQLNQEVSFGINDKVFPIETIEFEMI